MLIKIPTFFHKPSNQEVFFSNMSGEQCLMKNKKLLDTV